jgi:hypothetical protein
MENKTEDPRPPSLTPCYTRTQLGALAAVVGDATDYPIPYTLTPKALAVLAEDTQ